MVLHKSLSNIIIKGYLFHSVLKTNHHFLVKFMIEPNMSIKVISPFKASESFHDH